MAISTGFSNEGPSVVDGGSTPGATTAGTLSERCTQPAGGAIFEQYNSSSGSHAHIDNVNDTGYPIIVIQTGGGSLHTPYDIAIQHIYLRQPGERLTAGANKGSVVFI